MEELTNKLIKEIQNVSKNIKNYEEYENEIKKYNFEFKLKQTTNNDYAFRNCINLKEIQLPKSLEKIDFKKVFENCKEVMIEIEEENEYCKIEDDDVCCKK